MRKEKTEEIQDKKVNKKPEEVSPETPVDIEEKDDSGDDSSSENGHDEDDLTVQLAEAKDKFLRSPLRPPGSAGGSTRPGRRLPIRSPGRARGYGKECCTGEESSPPVADQGGTK